MSIQRRVTVLLYDGVNTVDVAGPRDAFAAVRGDDGEVGYALTFVSPREGAVTAESGLRLLPEPMVALQRARSAARGSSAKGVVDLHVARGDTLLVPGGRGVCEPATLRHRATWIGKQHVRFDRIVAVCTGAWALA